MKFSSITTLAAALAGFASICSASPMLLSPSSELVTLNKRSDWGNVNKCFKQVDQSTNGVSYAKNELLDIDVSIYIGISIGSPLPTVPVGVSNCQKSLGGLTADINVAVQALIDLDVNALLDVDLEAQVIAQITASISLLKSTCGSLTGALIDIKVVLQLFFLVDVVINLLNALVVSLQALSVQILAKIAVGKAVDIQATIDIAIGYINDCTKALSN